MTDIAVDPEGNFYTASLDNQIHRVEPTCNQVWTYPLPSSVTSVALDKHHNIYAGTSNGKIYKLSQRRDNQPCVVWKNTSHDAGKFIQDLSVDPQGFVYSGSADKSLRKIAPNGNESIWQYEYSTIVRDVAVENEYKTAFPDIFDN